MIRSRLGKVRQLRAIIGGAEQGYASVRADFACGDKARGQSSLDCQWFELPGAAGSGNARAVCLCPCARPSLGPHCSILRLSRSRPLTATADGQRQSTARDLCCSRALRVVIRCFLPLFLFVANEAPSKFVRSISSLIYLCIRMYITFIAWWSLNSLHLCAYLYFIMFIVEDLLSFARALLQLSTADSGRLQ